jgi:hypothetical protein
MVKMEPTLLRCHLLVRVRWIARTCCLTLTARNVIGSV